MPDPEEAAPERPHRRGRRRLLGGAVALVLVIAAAVTFVLLHAPHNVSHPDLSFTAPTTSTTATTTATKPTAPPVDNFSWPLYGENLTRTRAFTGAANLHPPFRRGWTLSGNALLEFPPVIHGHELWFMDDSATVKAVNTQTGKVIWQRPVGTLSSASPAIAPGPGILIVPVLSDHGRSPGNGGFVALSMRTGRTLWSHPLPSGAESQPLIYRNTVYMGDQAGTLFSLNLRSGHVNWTFQASGAIKGGAALQNNNLYIDDYGGHVYDVNAHTGRQIWVASADGGELGFSSGTFYTTPAVAFGRVYVGNTSGYIYSFAAGTGQLAWSYGTGAYVYASPAVADVPGLGPTVYAGSYNGDFYAFDAASGRVRWVHPDADHNRISGSSTIVNGVVYYSDLDDKLTTGLNARTGATVFSFHDGAFTPVIADPDHIYLSGGYTLYEFLPRDRLTVAGLRRPAQHTHRVRRAGDRGKRHPRRVRHRARPRRQRRTTRRG